MSNNAPLDPDQPANETTSLHHADIGLATQIVSMAINMLPDIAANNRVRKHLENGLTNLCGRELSVRADLIRQRTPDE